MLLAVFGTLGAGTAHPLRIKRADKSPADVVELDNESNVVHAENFSEVKP